MLNKVIKNSFVLSAGILLGRLSGFIRELITAKQFGISEEADQIILMLSIPDLLNNLLAAGAISGVLIPTLATHNNKLEQVIQEFTCKLFVLTILAYAILGVAIFCGYKIYVSGLLIMALLSAFPNVFTFIAASYLQYEKRFAKQSLSTLVFNLVIIICLLFGAFGYYFAAGIIGAGLVRMVWVVSDLKNTKYSVVSLFGVSKINQLESESYISYRILVVMILANGLLFVQPIIDKIFSSFLYEGATATLSYAEKIYLLPVSVFLTTYAVALFPDVSRLVADNLHNQAFKIMKKAIPFNLIISFLVAFFIWIFNKEIIVLLFSFAGFNEQEFFGLSRVLVAYLPVVVVAGCSSLLLNMLFAYRAYYLIIVFSVVIVLLKIILNLIILKLKLSVFYIAFSTAGLSVLGVILLLIFNFYICRREIKHVV